MLATVDETSKQELIEAHLFLHAEISGDLLALSPEVFYAPQGDHWSPVEPESALAEAGLTDLRGYEIALTRCAANGRRVFITPL